MTQPRLQPDLIDLLNSYERRLADLERSAQPSPLYKVGQPGSPSFGSGYGVYASLYGTPAFFRDSSGVVHLEGLAGVFGAPRAPNDTIFVLPPGFRPNMHILLPSLYDGGFTRLDISPAGAVYNTSTTTAWVGLNGVSFRAKLD